MSINSQILYKKAVHFPPEQTTTKNMRPGGELKLAMCLSYDWQQSEVTQVISPHASPIFNSKIIQMPFQIFTLSELLD